MTEAIHIIIRGRVQGVCFRSGTKEKAVELGILGWVKNTSEGTVEIQAEGEKSKLDNFIVWCRNGTPFANVTSITLTSISLQNFKSFEICS